MRVNRLPFDDDAVVFPGRIMAGDIPCREPEESRRRLVRGDDVCCALDHLHFGDTRLADAHHEPCATIDHAGGGRVDAEALRSFRGMHRTATGIDDEAVGATYPEDRRRLDDRRGTERKDEFDEAGRKNVGFLNRDLGLSRRRFTAQKTGPGEAGKPYGRIGRGR